jgi:SP family general alpha glucoside:H+ symporter-like MFS transporter
MYISELAPTQLRGFLINAYSLWFVVGQLMAPVALQQLNVSHPYDFKVAIYTQWAMIALIAVIYLILPESPCRYRILVLSGEMADISGWLVSKGKLAKAKIIMDKLHSDIPQYNAESQIVSTARFDRLLTHRVSW